MLDAFAQLNWLAIAVAALAYYLLGAVWFTPLFGKAWDRAIGHDRSADRRFGADYYVVPLLSATAVSVALGVILAATGFERMGDALGLGAVVGLGVAFAVSINNALTPHTPHPYLFGAVTGGYHLVGVIAVAAILSV